MAITPAQNGREKQFMKNKILVVLLAAFIVLTTLFLWLWRMEAKKHESCLQFICEYNIEKAKDAFENYSKTKQEKSYWYGVGCFHTFMCAYEQLSNADNDYMAIQGEAHVQMLHNAEKCMNNAEQLVEAMLLLSENYDTFIAKQALANLY